MNKFERIAVLGAGAFGVALTKLTSQKSSAIKLWGRDDAVCRRINADRHHPHRLPQIVFPHNVFATSDLGEAVRDAECVILAVPMQALPAVLADAKKYVRDDAILVSTAKGIEEITLRLPCDNINAIVSTSMAKRACYLSGPSFAIEVAMELPTALTIASYDQAAAMLAQNNLSSQQCRLYRSDDVIGVCVGGALKNVISIAAGACAGLGLGKNALAALITRGLAEMARLTLRLNGKAQTLSGLSGAGDLILSATDDMSRNHRLGTLLADGMSLDTALKTIGSVVEGAKTARAIPAIEKKHGIELPICHTVYRVLYENLSPKLAIEMLLQRALKDENF